MEEFQCGTLTATACDGSGPNEDHLRTALVTVVRQLWGGQLVVSHTHKKGTHDPETRGRGKSGHGHGKKVGNW